MVRTEFWKNRIITTICINFSLELLTIIKKYSYFIIKVGLMQNISTKLKYTEYRLIFDI
jgi:hypothetical protein